MNYIDILFEQAKKSQPWSVAQDHAMMKPSDSLTGQMVQNVVQKAPVQKPQQISKPQISQPTQLEPQVQPEVLIEADQDVMPIEYQEGYKPQVPQSEIVRQNYNKALFDQIAESKAIGENLQDMSGRYESEREAVKKSMSESDNIKMPEQNPWADVIAMFGAPLAAMVMGGEAAALAQQPAQKSAMGLVEGARKSDAERIKALQERIKERSGKQLELAKLSSQEIKDAEAKVLGLKKDISGGIQKGSEKVADIELQPYKAAEALKRAEAIAKTKPATEGERKGAFQFGLMEQAEKNLQDLKKKYGNYPSMNNKWFRLQKNIAGGMFGSTLASDFLNSKGIDEPTRQQIQSEIGFLESIGRIQSGAAVTVAEWSQMREPYFPTYGDSESIVATKDQQRQKALEGVKIIAGKAAPLVSKPVGTIKVDSDKKLKVTNGKKTFIIPQKDLEDAEKDGFWEVKSELAK